MVDCDKPVVKGFVPNGFYLLGTCWNVDCVRKQRHRTRYRTSHRSSHKNMFGKERWKKWKISKWMLKATSWQSKWTWANALANPVAASPRLWPARRETSLCLEMKRSRSDWTYTRNNQGIFCHDTRVPRTACSPPPSSRLPFYLTGIWWNGENGD